MIDYTVYDNATGEIVKSGSCVDSDLSLQSISGQSVAQGKFDDASEYYNGFDFVDRPKMSLTVSATIAEINEEIVISNIPEGTVVHYIDGSETVNDGIIEWSSVIAGMFTFIFVNFPYIEERLKIEINEP